MSANDEMLSEEFLKPLGLTTNAPTPIACAGNAASVIKHSRRNGKARQ
jgi:CubicO group peptidase (beta-lactamase class C family)